MKATAREIPISCLGQVFKSKLGHIEIPHAKCTGLHSATSRAENSAQVLSWTDGTVLALPALGEVTQVENFLFVHGQT
jgi:hypothetical protein